MATSNSSSAKCIFQCDQHAINILLKLQKCYKENKFFDTVLIAGENGIKIQAHRIVLSALSDYFCEIYYGNPATLNLNEVKLKTIEASTLKLIIDFMYSGTIELSSDNIEKLLQGAIILKMKNLLDGCCGFMANHLNKSNCLHAFRLANELRLDRLQEKSLTTFYNNFAEVRKQPEFSLLNESELNDLLFNLNPYGNFEEEVLLSLVDWSKHDEVNRGHVLFELLSKVRYQFLTPKFIVENTMSVCDNPKNSKLIHGWLKHHLSPESITIEQQNLAFTSEPEPSKKVKLNEEDSEVVAAIGFSEHEEFEMYTYDDKLKKWIIKSRSEPISSNKISNYSNIVIDDKLYSVGGFNTDYKATNIVECLDLRTFKLKELPPMELNRGDCQLANVNGHLCVFGAMDEDCEYVYSLEVFNILTDQWTVLEPPFRTDNENETICGHNGILYIFDNDYGFLQLYDFTSKQWACKKVPIDHNVEVLGISFIGNLMYAICCLRSSETTTVVKCLDLSRCTWSEECRFNNTPIVCSRVITSVIKNKIWITTEKAEVLEYNPETKKITPKEELMSANFFISPFKF